MELTVETFHPEMVAAMQHYDRYVVCLERCPDDCWSSLSSLVGKAIDAYVNRGPALRHGIALDKYLTVILSQTDDDRPLCSIYFNLHSPYLQRLGRKAETAGR